jgi:uncharacterized protein with PQ loop repeat
MRKKVSHRKNCMRKKVSHRKNCMRKKVSHRKNCMRKKVSHRKNCMRKKVSHRKNCIRKKVSHRKNCMRKKVSHRKKLLSAIRPGFRTFLILSTLILWIVNCYSFFNISCMSPLLPSLESRTKNENFLMNQQHLKCIVLTTLTCASILWLIYILRRRIYFMKIVYENGGPVKSYCEYASFMGSLLKIFYSIYSELKKYRNSAWLTFSQWCFYIKNSPANSPIKKLSHKFQLLAPFSRKFSKLIKSNLAIFLILNFKSYRTGINQCF